MIRILDEDGAQIFPDLEVMEVSIKDESTLTSYNVEDGGTRSDYIYDNPYEIDLDCFIVNNVAQQYEEIKSYKDRRQLVSVFAHTLWEDMLIVNLPSVLNTDAHLGLTITLRQYKEVSPLFGEVPTPVKVLAPEKVANKDQASTRKSGKPSSKNKKDDALQNETRISARDKARELHEQYKSSGKILGVN